MTVGDFSTAMKYLRTTDAITVTIGVAAFERAMEMATGGPEVMSTAQAAVVFGFGAKRWRRWAEADRIDGAWLDHEKGKKRGVWRLPREGCRRVIKEEQRKGRTRAKGNQERVTTRNANAGKKAGTSRERRVVSHQTAAPTTGRRTLRGPRKA